MNKTSALARACSPVFIVAMLVLSACSKQSALPTTLPVRHTRSVKFEDSLKFYQEALKG